MVGHYCLQSVARVAFSRLAPPPTEPELPAAAVADTGVEREARGLLNRSDVGRAETVQSGSQAPDLGFGPAIPAASSSSGFSAGDRVHRDSGAPAVLVDGIGKVFHPSPMWLRLMLKSAIKQPVVALEEISFEVGVGEICVVIGPNGAGKSTLFKILTGLLLPTSGRAEIQGVNVSNGRQVRSMIGYMPADEGNLLLRHTCAQNLAFRGKLQSIPRRDLPDRIDEVLEQVGILGARDQAAISMSTGMRTRLQLAAALLHRPKILLLDEPTSAIDPVGAYELLLLIERLAKESGLSIILSSHRLEEIDALHNRVVVLDKGRLVHNGNLSDLRRLWEQPRYRVAFASAGRAASIASRLHDSHPDLQVEIDDECLEINTDRSAGGLLSVFLPEEVDSVASFEKVTMPLRALLYQLVVRR